MSLRRVRTVAVVGAVALIGTAACSGGENDATDGADGSGSGDGRSVELELVTLSGLVPGLEPIIEEFEASHEGISIEARELDGGQFFTVLPTQISSGQGPDLFLTFPGNGNGMATHVLGPTGYLADLSDLDYVEDLSPELRELASVDGVPYYVPGFGAAQGALYDQDVWEEAGLEPPSTFSEMLDLCEEAQGMGQSLFALGISSPLLIQGISYSLVGSNVYAQNPDFDEQMEAGEATFTGSGWEDALHRFAEMEQAGCFNEGMTGLSSDQAQDLLVANEALAHVNAPGEIVSINTKAGEERNWSMFALPGTDDPSETRLPAAPGIGYSAYAEGEHVDAAKEFLAFFSQPDIRAQYEAANLTTPGDPGSTNLSDDAPVNDVLQSVTEYYENGQVAPYPDQWWPNPQVQDVHTRGVQSLLLGETTVEQILQDMDEAYTAEN